MQIDRGPGVQVSIDFTFERVTARKLAQTFLETEFDVIGHIMSNLPTNGETSIAGAAALLGIDRKTVRRAIARGDLPARRIGPRLVRIRLEDVNAYGEPLGSPSE